MQRLTQFYLNLAPDMVKSEPEERRGSSSSVKATLNGDSG